MRRVFVQIVSTKGSVPRGSGTAMEVSAGGTRGTIGGGALEFQATVEARKHLETLREDIVQTFALGPSLGQCCGGSVTLRFTREVCAVDDVKDLPPLRVDPSAPLRALWLWGAGHVGRAVVSAAPEGAFDMTWVDTERQRFPVTVPSAVTVLPAADMAVMARRAPTEAHHFVFTYSHDIDLAVCAALLSRGASSVGLIGSDTKRARFIKRLRAMNIDTTRLRCPIGDPTLGKRPDQIARGVMEDLLTQEVTA